MRSGLVKKFGYRFHCEGKKRCMNNSLWVNSFKFWILLQVLPNFPDHCVWSPTLKLTSAQIVSMEIMLRPVIPYMIPALLLPWPLIILRSTLTSVEGSKLKCQIQTIIIIGWSYICLNIPYSLTFLAHYVSMMKGVSSTFDD